MVETDIFEQMSPHSDPELEESKPIFLHDTLAHDDSSAFQVWLKKKKKKFNSPGDIVKMNIY